MNNPPACDTRKLSAIAFSRCGDDADFYNGVHELEQQIEVLRAERDALGQLRKDMCAAMNCSGDFLVRIVGENKAERNRLREALTVAGNLLKRFEVRAEFVPDTQPACAIRKAAEASRIIDAALRPTGPVSKPKCEQCRDTGYYQGGWDGVKTVSIKCLHPPAS
jgi:hypothetical protein